MRTADGCALLHHRLPDCAVPAGLNCPGYVANAERRAEPSSRGWSEAQSSAGGWFREHQIGFRLKKLGRWLTDGKSLWITLFGWAGAFGIGWGAKVLGPSGFELSDQFRVAGWALQILGISTVAVGLKKTRDIFDVPSVKEQFVEWVKRFPTVFARRQTITGTASLSGAGTASVKGYGIVGPVPDASIEERLDVLEEKYKHLSQQLIDARNEIKSEAQRLDKAVKQERRARSQADTEIRAQLESFSVGGLHLESMGLAWLLLGITCATLPAEMAELWTWVVQ